MKYPIKKIKKAIADKERRAGRRLSEKGRRKVAQRVIRRTRLRNRIFATLATLGIAIGGTQALLPEGKASEMPENKTKVETVEQGKKITKKEAYMQELRVNPNEYTKAPVQKDTELINEILEAYNGNLLQQAEIDIDDVGIILQYDGHIEQVISENGDISFIEYGTKEERMDSQEGPTVWVESDDIDTVYTLVDTQNNNTIAGYGVIDGEYHEVEVESVRNRSNGIEYRKNDRTYVGVPEEQEGKKIYENFSNYYQKRMERQELAKKDEGR